MQGAKEYIAEDHVDGEDSEEAIEQRERIEPLLKALDIVENDAELRAVFTKQYNDNFAFHRTLILNDNFKGSAKLLLKRLAESKTN